MWLSDLLHHTLRGVPFWIILVSGIFGILIDIDHPISHYLLPSWSGRFLHTPILIGSCIVLCVLGAYCGGLYAKYLLGG